MYTVIQRNCATIHSFITLTNVSQLLKFFHSGILQKKLAIKGVSYFPSHLKGVTALPCEIQKTKLTKLAQFFFDSLCINVITVHIVQAPDGAETATIDWLVSSWFENISVWFCLPAPGYRLTLMHPWSSSRWGRNRSASVTVTVQQLLSASTRYAHGVYF